MSIIYDALQKTQRNREYLRLQNALTQKKSHHRNLKWMVLGSLILVVSAGVGAIFTFYVMPSTNSPVMKSPPAAAKLAPPAAMDAGHLWVTDSKKTTEAPLLPPIENSLAVAPLVAQAEVPPPLLTAAQPLKITAAVLPETRPLNSKLTLNGVLISGEEKIALINNQSFRLGDVVDGMKIVDIEFNNVKLQNGKQVVELRVPV